MRYWAIRVTLFELPFAALFVVSIMAGLYTIHSGDALGTAFWATVAILLTVFHDRAQAQVLRLAGDRS